MDAPIEELYNTEDGGITVMFRIISRHSWDEMQSWKSALPGSRVEHLMYGLYVLIVNPGGAQEIIK